MERLSESPQKQASAMTPRLKEQSLGFITVTGVSLSHDVKMLKVFYSVLGTAEDREKSQAALEHATYRIRRDLGKLENLRRVPEIEFIFDDGPERADRIQRLLMQIESEKNEK